MWTNIRSSTPIARKDYHCNASEQLLESGLVTYEGVIDDFLSAKLSVTEKQAISVAATRSVVMATLIKQRR